jgi:hypothetical protein
MPTNPRAPKTPSERIADFIESTVGDSDEAITMVDRDLVTGNVIILFKTGERLKISIVSDD